MKNIIKNSKTKKNCFFFDRDNTLIVDKGYVHKKKDLKWKPHIINILKKIKNKKFLIIVITNQSGVARGFYSEKDVLNFHNFMNQELKKKKTFIDDFYFCPYHIDGNGIYKKKSKDRKPDNGMIKKAIKKWNIDVSKSYFIGDKKTDYMAAKKSKLKFIKENKNLRNKINYILNKFNIKKNFLV
jgi:D,D-heptose 1,7-bisphosphate phosphatase